MAKGYTDVEGLDYTAPILSLKNPGTTTILSVERPIPDGPLCFQRMFICYDALKKGLSFCRLVLCIDFCHLISPFSGILLSVVCRDGNNQTFVVTSTFVAF